MPMQNHDHPAVLVAHSPCPARSRLAQLVRRHGFAAKLADDFDSAFESLRIGSFRLCIAEVELAPQSGLELMQIAAQERPNVPFILCSTSWNVSRAVEAMRLGAFHYFTHPLSKREFVHALRDAAQARQGLVTSAEQTGGKEAIGRIVGRVAHDFNNLLTVIRSSSILLKEQVEPLTMAGQLADEIHDASERACTLTDQLLAFAHAKSRVKSPVQFDNVVRSLRKMITRITAPSCIDVVLELGADDAWLDADVSQLEQVLLNLVVNARDAMPNGGTLHVKTAIERRVPIDGQTADHLVLSVSDTGIGISDNIRGRIFEPFFTTKPADRGTGLGLPIVRDIITEHGGNLMVESETGKGTKFVITFPLLENQATEETRALQSTGR